MVAINDRTPVIVGVGQVVDHWDGSDAATAPSPLSLAGIAAEAALADTGHDIGPAIDRVVFVRTMLDSIPGAPQPFGRCANLPATLACDIGIDPRQAIYSIVGGDQPQVLINEAAEAVFAGEVRAVLIVGAEATAALKTAVKAQITLDWSRSVDKPVQDRGLGPALLSAYELANGLGMPTRTYPLFEHALRPRLGLSRAAHVALMSELWSGFSQVAAQNPYAAFPVVRTPEFLSRPSAENYPVADPYLKWHVAQDAVNQGAAVILTSVGEAERLGIKPGVFLRGYAQAKDLTPLERPDLSRSRAIELTLQAALAAAGCTTAGIGHFDLYSCFPCAVLLAAEALGLDWRRTPATVTGGLPFFGGPGNNYSLHAIATMVERLRADPGSFGLVLANGGFLSKEAVGIYSTSPSPEWQPCSSTEIQCAIDAAPRPRLLAENAEASIDSYTVVSARGVATDGYIAGQTASGDRILARTRRGDAATLSILSVSDPLGSTVRVEHENGMNFLIPPGQSG